jgi:hypothetical protein
MVRVAPDTAVGPSREEIGKERHFIDLRGG